jgi:hypothetical protein
LRYTLLVVPGQTGFPPQRLREILTSARNAGLSWQTAWKVGRRAALKGVSTEERRAWTIALNGTERAWKAAYERRSSPCPAWPLEPPTPD